MKVRLFFCAALALAAATSATAADLYENNRLRDISRGAVISTEDTIGGYAIYPGDGKWKFAGGRVGTSTGAANVAMGTVFMEQWEDGEIFAAYAITANLQYGSSHSWTGVPCGPNHLIMINKGRGQEDNCLTIDATAVSFGGPAKTMLMVRSTLTGANARYYYSELLINPEFLGALDTTVADWSIESIPKSTHRKEVVERLTQWAVQFHDRANKAYAFSKPQDAYENLASFRTILPVPEALANNRHSLSFLSAVEDLRHQTKPAAIAYFQVSDYRTRWGRSVGAATQSDAEQDALKKCEKFRPSTAPTCVLYR